MHKIDAPHATDTNEFTDGDPATGIEATEINAKWLNAVQSEITSVIEGLGLILSDSDNDQLLEAITLIISTHANLLSPHGATAEAIAERLALRNAEGRTAFAPGVDIHDAVVMGQIAALTNAASSETPSVLAIRDGSGKSSFVGGTAGNEAVVFSQFAGSYGYNAFSGWFALPNGVVVQWGGANTGTEETWAAQSFPYAFPNQALVIIGSANEAVTTLDPVIAFRAISASQYEVYNAGYPNRGVSWIAIGR